MPTSTTNYELKKPIKATENADIDVINANMDILDTVIKTNADAVAQSLTNKATNAELTALETSIEAQLTSITELQWKTPTLLEGWVNIPNSQVLQYTKDSFGIVHLRGSAKNSTATTIAFILPTGFRPSFKITTIIAYGIDSFVQCTINENGYLQVWSTAINDFHFDNISFATT